MAERDPIYVTWQRRNKGGRLEEVDIFKFISEHLGSTTQKWNEVGLGSIIFPKGTLKITNFGEKSSFNLEAMLIEIDLRTFTEGLRHPEAGLAELYNILSSDRILRLEEKAYLYVVDLLEQWLANNDRLTIPREPQYAKPSRTFVEKIGGKVRRRKRDIRMEMGNRGYGEGWVRLVNQIILNRKPRQVGDGVVSFSLEDLLSIRVTSSNSKFTSIFMMEEFGTGLFADPDLRRPFLSFGATPFKVPPQIADEFRSPDAIYMWWPFGNMRARARMLMIGRLHEAGRSTIGWLKESMRHSKRTSLKEYRKKAFEDIRNYRGGSNPLDWAYGSDGTVPGHKGRRAMHLFFDRNGIVEGIRIIQEEGTRRLLELIDEEIEKVVANFPSLADAILPR